MEKSKLLLSAIFVHPIFYLADILLIAINDDFGQLNATIQNNNQLNQRNIHQLKEEQNETMQIIQTNIDRLNSGTKTFHSFFV